MLLAPGVRPVCANSAIKSVVKADAGASGRSKAGSAISKKKEDLALEETFEPYSPPVLKLYWLRGLTDDVRGTLRPAVAGPAAEDGVVLGEIEGPGRVRSGPRLCCIDTSVSRVRLRDDSAADVGWKRVVAGAAVEEEGAEEEEAM